MRMILAIFICKFSRLCLRMLGRGGTNLPGKLALKCCPNLLAHLGKQVNTVVVTGTNGKTTTARMLEEAYKQAKISEFSNRSGANLLPGITAEFTQHANIFGKMRKTHAIIECDEAAFRHVSKYLDAKIILVTNVFRDQLDRYGEISHTLSSIRAGIDHSPNASICINADCPLLVQMVQGIHQPIYYFGAEESLGQEAGKGMAEAARCPDCGATFTYHYKTYGHLGDFACPQCDYKRPERVVSVVKLLSSTPDNSTVELNIGGNVAKATINLPGVYNIYNALGAVAVCHVLKMEVSHITAALAKFQGGFGRMEAMTIGKTTARMILVKNPIGATQVLEYLAAIEGKFQLVICLNDQSGDGADVSWIWDVETDAFEKMQENVTAVYCGGTRADDLAVWLKYSSVLEEKIHLAYDMDTLLNTIAASDLPVYIMPTYTAMLELRGKLEKEHGLKRFWE